MEKIIMNLEDSITNRPHKIFLNLSQILDLRSSDKHVAFKAHLFITCGKI